MTHELKIHPEHYQEITLGLKKVEVRLNDRNYQEGDILLLNEYNPKAMRYTGNQDIKKVSYVIKDVAGLAPDYVILQISKLL
jgi:ASC-1-like (ASCH) protein